MGKYLIGIDEGTMGCKTCIFDFDGNLVAYDYREYPCLYPQQGWVEQNPDDLTEGLFTSCKEAIKKSGIDPREIAALGLSTQGGPIGCTDENGKMIGNFISWMDGRCMTTDPDVSSYIDPAEYYQIEGWSIRALAMPCRTYIWLRENRPEFFEAAHIVTSQDYFLRQFGVKESYSDISSACREGTADIDKGVFSQKIHDMLGMDLKKRPKLMPNGAVVGAVSKEASEKCGLAEGTPICIGALDQDCSTFGSGMIRDGDACIVMGTLGACYVCSEKSVRDPQERLIVKVHSKFEEGKGPTTYTLEGMSMTSASSFRWYRDAIGVAEKEQAHISGQDAYTLLCNGAEQSVPGANGVMFLPFLQGCAVRNWADLKGTFTGIGLDTTRNDLTRAVLEGITYEMQDIIGIVESTGVEIHQVCLVGGPTKSDFWCQMQADIYQKPVVTMTSPETGCLGAAMFAGVGIGVYRDAYEAVERAVHVGKVYQPDPAKKDVYAHSFAKFKEVSAALHKA